MVPGVTAGADSGDFQIIEMKKQLYLWKRVFFDIFYKRGVGVI